ncbi:MAG: DNA-binding protein [Actinobacteria bacterium]|nr:DNA-binding protein [Actinomycetota bacterium]
MLVGAAEIAERLGVKRPQVVHDWHHRHAAFPRPVATLRQAMVWDWRDVEAWARKTGRLEG